MRKNDLPRLRHILDAAEEAVSFSARRSRQDLELGACPTENLHPNQLWSVVIPDPRCGQKIGDFRSVGQTPRPHFSPADGPIARFGRQVVRNAV